MSQSILEFLGTCFPAGEARSIGQVVVRETNASWRLCHVDDAGRSDLVEYNDAWETVEIARFDDAGNYRPLKSAPNLRHGWLLVLRNRESLREALDSLYPGAIGAWKAYCEGTLPVTPLRETLLRQTGMYRITGKATTAEAGLVAATCCHPVTACLRTILWTVEPEGFPPATLPLEKFEIPENDASRIPVLCAEICNLFVSECRVFLKKSPTLPV